MNIRPATKDDADFIGSMMYEAARWNPDWPRETLEEFLGEPGLRATTRTGAERATAA